MTEQQGQDTAAQENAQGQAPGNETPQEQRQDATVPSSRLREETAKRKEAERKLQELESERQRQEEERAQNQGEYQKLAEKRAETIKQKDARIKELEGQIVRDRRYRSFVGASGGMILPDALDDAFAMLTDDEWASVDDSDAGAVKMLAQNLADRKPYLAAGPRGAGSGGSSRPVFDAKDGYGNRRRSPLSKTASGRKPYK